MSISRLDDDEAFPVVAVDDDFAASELSRSVSPSLFCVPLSVSSSIDIRIADEVHIFVIRDGVLIEELPSRGKSEEAFGATKQEIRGIVISTRARSTKLATNVYFVILLERPSTLYRSWIYS